MNWVLKNTQTLLCLRVTVLESRYGCYTNWGPIRTMGLGSHGPATDFYLILSRRGQPRLGVATSTADDKTRLLLSS